MSTFKRADKAVEDMMADLIGLYHEPLKEAGVTVDLVMAYGATNEDGELVGDALTKDGQQCFGLCRIVPLKDRAMGRSDAEISLDGDWWAKADHDEQQAVLDHELTHLKLKLGKDTKPQTDDLGRPVLKLRRHDFQVGWFKEVAARHGEFSVEQRQAKAVMDDVGQFFWPDLCKKIEIGVPAEVAQQVNRFVQIARNAGASVRVTSGGDQ